MLYDFNEASTRAAAKVYDVCICGTGPSGITIARKLAAGGKSILLLEGGDLEFSEQSQKLYAGQCVGVPDWYLTRRSRRFGGASNDWGGRCGLLQPADFAPHDYFGLPGWPISRGEVLANLDEAKDILNIRGKNLDRFKIQSFDSPLFVNDGYAASDPVTNFAEKYGDEIRKSDKIDGFYDANLVDIKLNESLTRVINFRIQNYNRKAADVSANQFILALGAIPNAQILLNARSQIPAGVGNRGDMVGRCFMEHLDLPIGRFVVTDAEFWRREQLIVAPTESLTRDKDIGNGSLTFNPDLHPRDYGRLRVIKHFLRETGCAVPVVARVARQVVDLYCPGDGVITSLIEQSPNRDSRITLTDQIDGLGLRRVRLNWQINDRDRRTIRTLAMEVAKEMARLDRARVQLAPFILDRPIEMSDIFGHCHQLGTTRMSSDPRYGVVDVNCQVHGVENLYAAGGSVFSTGGGINPTTTIVLLALRLAEFLKRKA
jgi:choline dehydrogenase-like flavoprotein